jgi:hypothetical protein
VLDAPAGSGTVAAMRRLEPAVAGAVCVVSGVVGAVVSSSAWYPNGSHHWLNGYHGDNARMMASYLLVDYSGGLRRRGLLGFFASLFTEPDQITVELGWWVWLGVYALVVALVAAVASRAVARHRSVGWFGVAFMASPFGLRYLAGEFHPSTAVLIAGLGAVWVLSSRPGVVWALSAGAVGAVGALVHDQVGLTLTVAAFVGAVAVPGARRRWRLVASLAPAAATEAVLAASPAGVPAEVLVARSLGPDDALTIYVDYDLGGLMNLTSTILDQTGIGKGVATAALLAPVLVAVCALLMSRHDVRVPAVVFVAAVAASTAGFHLVGADWPRWWALAAWTLVWSVWWVPWVPWPEVSARLNRLLVAAGLWAVATSTVVVNLHPFLGPYPLVRWLGFVT